MPTWTVPPLRLHIAEADDDVFLPASSQIQLQTLSGGDIDESCGLPKQVISSEQGGNAISLTRKWKKAFTRTLQVPDDCIFFCWSCNGHKSYQVVVVFIPLSDERRSELLGDVDSPCSICSVCCVSPRRRRGDNIRPLQQCSTCNPPYCCDRCKVKVRGGEVKCYLCLTEEEFVQASEDHPHESLRLKLLTGPWPAAVEDDEFNDRASRSSSEASASTMRSSSEAPAPKRLRRQREAIDDEASAPTRG